MKAVVALGANIGNPSEQMNLAIAMLKEATEVIAISSFYTTKPVGGPEQPDYINAVCILESELPALDLLSLLQGIEKSLGRERIERWGPRTIDLDLIQYGSLLSKAEELELPHPRAHERRFVIEPWHEIEPDAVLLTHGKISELLAQLP
ncbi:2-amino-4-hydroxy-6-hydroxymethyldihydropteridine diphosphokinase [Candidatus Planktophila sulfonica]|jgi:2-amino-4-hydroxy-6-hydroxymethyldihydropteridine diphosphokinase|uniref:2-amino-4-hydroxy-6-hydroxymethyldihydropteridine diphosphokinase n=1 Tax=Candidatus Planktophila sulfonica TaxID=1884904 RepID=A0A249KIE1_9ACTN|nr:2-amino-4-hydroxy-6-hydroxymethyldihydropteridine diphosphokinase [Candidatus Planktophila sulfonica]ASY16449.1 2-amino-4-hydroxy-6-hydroxymethyldihydropteridine diphosphokinase [Candidatus Planktophila sulfonica]